MSYHMYGDHCCWVGYSTLSHIEIQLTTHISFMLLPWIFRVCQVQVSCSYLECFECIKYKFHALTLNVSSASSIRFMPLPWMFPVREYKFHALTLNVSSASSISFIPLPWMFQFVYSIKFHALTLNVSSASSISFMAYTLNVSSASGIRFMPLPWMFRVHPV